MQYVNAIIAVALAALAVVFFQLGDGWEATIFGVGAVLAAVAFKHWLAVWMVRLLAFFTAVLLFCYFGQFFVLVPSLQPDWYWQAQGLDAVGLLFAGFGMIPVLSEYSCRMKASAECERGRRQFQDRRPLLATLREAAAHRSTS